MAEISPRRGSPTQFALFRFLAGLGFLGSFVCGVTTPQPWLRIAGGLLALAVAVGWKRKPLAWGLLIALVVSAWLSADEGPRGAMLVLNVGIAFLLGILPEGEPFSFSPGRGAAWAVPPIYMSFAEILFFGGGWFCAYAIYRDGSGLILWQESIACRLAVLGVLALDTRWLHPKFTAKPPIVFFDGVCGLCNSFIDWLFVEDANQLFRVSALQSDFAKNNLDEKYVRGDMDPTSIVLKDESGVYDRSTAVLMILSYLGGVFRWAPVFLIIPKFLRDPAYCFVAKNRYKWFGKKETCRLPTKEERARFFT